MMGLYQAASLAPPPALFVRRTIFGISHHNRETVNHLSNVERCMPLTFVFKATSRALLLGLYPVALGPENTAGFVLVRCP